MNDIGFPRPFDAQAAAIGVENWTRAAGDLNDRELADWATALASDPEGRGLLTAIAGNSPFLGQALPREIKTVRDFMTAGFDLTFQTLIAGVEATDEDDIDALMAVLRRAKRSAALLIACADILGAWSLEAVTTALSDLAEAALRKAADHVMRDAARRGSLIPFDPARPNERSGFIVLGMGKLGSRELNYSSDIDLIIFYDDEIARAADPDRLARTFIRAARDLVRIMEERTRDGYVFRTDLRLRPDPGATAAAVSVSAAEIYYGSVGQNWERAAMIKARPVAGDMEAGRSFLRSMEPFIWRRHLDFAAIQDIHSIKRQINAHKGHRFVTVNGHDVKVGRGGIREVEFFAQTQQLIFGGRDSSVRVASTVAALRALVELGRIPASTADELTDAYRFLRVVEHRLQMVDDQQTQRLPETDEGIEHIAAFLGFADAESFRTTLIRHMRIVEDNYAELFEGQPPLSERGNLVFTGTDDDPGTIETLRSMGFAEPSRVIAVVSAWHRGRYRATRLARAREILTELVPSLLEALSRTTKPDDALLALDTFLMELSAGIGVFSLLHSNPHLLSLIAEIMGSAPRLAHTLGRNPGLLDAVLTRDFFTRIPSRGEVEAEYAAWMTRAGDFEEALNLARAWTNDQRFRAGVHILRGVTDGARCAPFLADAADTAVSDIARRTEEAFASGPHGRLPGGRFAVIAMGKLGGRQITIASDIDLIVVYDAPAGVVSDGRRPLSAAEWYIRLTQRLTSAINSPLADGRLYEVDMRLRPSGNAGPLAVSLETFRRYQTTEAWTWEHMALTRARVIHGPGDLRDAIEATIRTVLTRPRDAAALLRDAADMRRRIDGQYATDNPWDVKYVRGGMIDIDFIAQYLQLRHGAERQEILSVDTRAALRTAGALGFLDPRTAGRLADTFDTWLRVQGWSRLTTIEAPIGETMNAAQTVGLARAAFPDAPPVDFPTLETMIRNLENAAHGDWRTLIEEPAARLPVAENEETHKS